MINGLTSGSQFIHGKGSSKSFPRRDGLANTGIKQSFARNNPSQVSFSGLVCPKNLENLKIIETLQDLTKKEHFPLRKVFTQVRKFVVPEGDTILKGKDLHKATSELIDEAIDSVLNPGKEVSASAKKFMSVEENVTAVRTFLDDVKMAIKNTDGDSAVIDYNADAYKNLVKKSTNEAVKVLNSTDNPGFLYKSKLSEKIFNEADKKQLMFQAAVSVLLACFLRPATIVSLPGKKNKDDKIYASAHSVSSGTIGYIESFLIATPLTVAITKIAKNPAKFLKENTSDFLGAKKILEEAPKAGRRIAKDATELIDAKRFGIARKYLGMLPGVCTAVPQAMLTVALIPVVLKHVFGLEKKSHGAKAAAVKTITTAAVADSNTKAKNYPLVGFKSVSDSTQKVFHDFLEGAK